MRKLHLAAIAVTIPFFCSSQIVKQFSKLTIDGTQYNCVNNKVEFFLNGIRINGKAMDAEVKFLGDDIVFENKTANFRGRFTNNQFIFECCGNEVSAMPPSVKVFSN